MISNHYNTQTGMHSDTYFTGKLYPKLNAYLKLKDDDFVYICSSCQFKTQRRFKRSLMEQYTFAEGSQIITEKEKQ